MNADRRSLHLATFLAVTLLIAALLVARSIGSAATTPLFADTDDAMRLVTVRDLLAGQNWYDLVQHRLNTPIGAEIHWSRLIDAAIGALIVVVQPFAGGQTETVIAYVWPLLLLGAAFALSAGLAVSLSGREALVPALLLPALAPAMMTEFSPGRLDHHGVQIVLLLAMAAASIGAMRRPALAVWSGIAAATALAIGIEGLPGVVAAIAGFSLAWVFRPEHARALRLFGVSFALAGLAHLAIALPPGRWLEPACDALSIVYVAAAMLSGCVLAALASLPRLRAGRPVLRLAALALAGAATAGVLALLFPGCLRGPYSGLDPWLVGHWLDRIVEAKPAWASLPALPAYVAACVIPPVIGLATAVWMTHRQRADADRWLMLVCFIALTAAVMLVQLRGARLATPMGAIGGAALIVLARRQFVATKSASAALALVASWFASAGLVIAVAVNLALTAMPGNQLQALTTANANKQLCLMPDAYGELAVLPPQRVMAFIDLGSHILADTAHSVVAAPYHRNQSGVRDTFSFFNSSIVEARQIAEARGIGLVVVCNAMAEMDGLADGAPDSFVRLHALGALPAWLHEISAPGAALTIYAISR